MKQYRTDFNAFEWRFPRSLKEAKGYEYEVTLESPKEKRQRLWSCVYRDWETDRKSTRLNSSHSAKSRMPSSA